jgi:hypothetical protein
MLLLLLLNGTDANVRMLGDRKQKLVENGGRQEITGRTMG